MAATGITVPLSGNSDIDGLMASGAQRWNTGNLTYSFPASASFYAYDGEPDEGFVQLPLTLQNAVLRAFTTFSQYANLRFAQEFETLNRHADLRVAMTNLEGAAGTAYFPGDDAEFSGDIWFQFGLSQFNDLDRGGQGFMTVMHEIGHALGLSHVGTSFDPTHIGWDYTIMSYQPHPAGDFDAQTVAGRYAQTPMLADVAALQYMYGANFTTNNTDTVYRWSQTTGEMSINGVGQGAPDANVIYMTLWDGGGNDTYDFSNYTSNVVADLRPGESSSPAFRPDQQLALSNQVAILEFPGIFARGSIANALLFNGDTRSLIENAIGGSGSDRLTGNQANNVLRGNGGDDTFFYTAGRDTFLGGARGSEGDTADFSTSARGIIVSPRVTTITSTGPNGQPITVVIEDTSPLADASGNAYSVNVRVPNTAVLVPIADLTGIENIIGTSQSDRIIGNGGNNLILGGGGEDVLFGGDRDDQLGGGTGNDTVNGGTGNDAYLFTGINQGSDIFNDEGGFDRVIVNNLLDVVRAVRDGTDLVVTMANGTFRIDDHFAGHAIERLEDRFGNSVVLSTTTTGGDLPGIIAGGPKSDALDGRGGDDLLFGYRGRDTLLGGPGNDLLDGGKGADVLVGGPGDDILVGGGGPDVFVFAPGVAAGDDVISDFQHSDTIDLSAFATTFQNLDDDKDRRLEDGEGDGAITIEIDHGDTVFLFAEGSIRVEGVVGLQWHDFLF